MKKILLQTVFLIVLVVPVVSQTEKTAGKSEGFPIDIALGKREQTTQLTSKLLGRKVPYRVILPDGYWNPNDSGRVFPVIYLLHGLTGHFDRWTGRTKVIDYSQGYNWIIVTPEGENGWYSDSVSNPNDKYESYIITELIPEIDKRFRTIAERRGRVIAGLSMGGYGAIKFGLKYPEMFSHVGSFSGALGAASYNEKNAGAIGKGIDAIFGPDDSDARKANDIFGLIREIKAENPRTLPFIYLSCGNEDLLIKSNRDFMALLAEKKVRHEYRQHPGIHDWVFWDDQVREFLAVAERINKK